MQNQTTTEFDAQKAETFAGRMVGTLSNAALALMTSLGHRTGLFDALAGAPDSSSAELASRAGLTERYVREWLAVMVTSQVVDYDPATRRYTLPAEHGAFLTRAAIPDNLAVTSQFIGVAASVEDAMIERFRKGGGLDYGHFDRFHEVMAEDSGQITVSALIERILPIVPGLTKRLHGGIDVVDVGCGAGHALLKMAETYPRSRFVGIDLCPDAFAETQVEAARRGIGNLRFEARDLSKVEAFGTFDLITAFDAVHDQPDPQALLCKIRRSLLNDGVFLMQDIGGSHELEANIDNPFAPLLYTISLMHCTPISVGQGGEGLGAMWGVETAREFLTEAGFDAVEMHRLDHDPINVYFVVRPRSERAMES
jgi:SAM-dependent methyltransferase